VAIATRLEDRRDHSGRGPDPVWAFGWPGLALTHWPPNGSPSSRPRLNRLY